MAVKRRDTLVLRKLVSADTGHSGLWTQDTRGDKNTMSGCLVPVRSDQS